MEEQLWAEHGSAPRSPQAERRHPHGVPGGLHRTRGFVVWPFIATRESCSKGGMPGFSRRTGISLVRPHAFHDSGVTFEQYPSRTEHPRFLENRRSYSAASYSSRCAVGMVWGWRAGVSPGPRSRTWPGANVLGPRGPGLRGPHQPGRPMSWPLFSGEASGSERVLHLHTCPFSGLGTFPGVTGCPQGSGLKARFLLWAPGDSPHQPRATLHLLHLARAIPLQSAVSLWLRAPLSLAQ